MRMSSIGCFQILWQLNVDLSAKTPLDFLWLAFEIAAAVSKARQRKSSSQAPRPRIQRKRTPIFFSSRSYLATAEGVPREVSYRSATSSACEQSLSKLKQKLYESQRRGDLYWSLRLSSSAGVVGKLRRGLDLWLMLQLWINHNRPNFVVYCKKNLWKKNGFARIWKFRQFVKFLK